MIEVRQLASFKDTGEFFLHLELSNPFCSREWIENMFNNWESLSLTGNPFLLGVYQNGNLCGIAPLSKNLIKIKGLVPIKIIKFFHTTYSDYCDFVSSTNLHSEVLSAVLKYLKNNEVNWDILWLTEIPEWSDSNIFLPEILKKQGFHYFRAASTNCYRITLPSTVNEYYSQISRGRRSNLRNYMNKLLKLGDISFGVASQNEIATAINAFFDLHQKKWNQEGKTGVFAEQNLRNVFYGLLMRMFEANLLRLFYLKLNDNYIAATVRFACGKSLYGWLTGYDPDYKNLRIGASMHIKTIQYAIENQFKFYDLMRGDHRYKEELSAIATPNFAYGISKSKFKLMAFRTIEKLSSLRRKKRE